MTVLTILTILIAFIILAAMVAVEAKGLLSSVISVGAAGLALSVIFLVLGAPDLAITQVVVEVLCLVWLIRATGQERDTTFEARRDRFVVAVGLFGGGIVMAITYYAFQSLVDFGSPLMTLAKQYLEHGMEETGAANYVMAVLLDFRAYDTLGEATVIFGSIIGAYAVIRKIGRLKDAGYDADSQASN